MSNAKWYANWVRMIPAQTAPEKMRNLEAADLIEALAAELEQVKQERDGLSIMLTATQSAAETYKRERDTAVADVAKLKRCEHCIGYEEFLKIDGNIERCNACEERSHWQWRGVKEG